MSEHEKAIGKIRAFLNTHAKPNERAELAICIDLLQAALKKEKPKKPNHIEQVDMYGFANDFYYCASCGRGVEYHHEYCSKCGQKVGARG